MILTALLLSAAAQAPAPPAAPSPQVQSDMVVLGGKLKKFRTRVWSKGETMHCTTLKSTGDKELDAIGCTSASTCMSDLRPRLVASADRKLPAAERKRLKNAVGQEWYDCTMARRDALIAELAERRWQARQGTNDASN